MTVSYHTLFACQEFSSLRSASNVISSICLAAQWEIEFAVVQMKVISFHLNDSLSCSLYVFIEDSLSKYGHKSSPLTISN
jgi:hypothetical protein